MLTDISLTTISDDKRAILNETLADLGFPSVYDLHEPTIGAYYSTISDAWSACDQTDEDVDAIVRARDAIFNAFHA